MSDLEERTIQEAMDEGFDDAISRQKYIDPCETCQYSSLDWDEEPCDSCTVGEENHWKLSELSEIKRDSSDMISRQAALRTDCFGDGHDGLRAFHMYEDYLKMRKYLESLPSVQPEDWMERNKDRILQAGMEGREIEFRIGGRLFAIREKAQ